MAFKEGYFWAKNTMNATWLDRSEYPFESKHFGIGSNKLHYIDEGKGDILLFVHGTPSWSFDFRNVIKELQNSFRCIAIDHIGFGLSDKPKDYDYSTINHSKTLEKFIIEKELQNITLVVHDFGGPIGLSAAINHASRFKRIVILNSWLWSSKGDQDFIKLSKMLNSPMLPFLYRYLNFSPRFVLPSAFGDKKLPHKLKKYYTLPFSNKDERWGALAFAQSLLNDQDWFQFLWDNKATLIEKPTLLIWGMKDPVIKPHYLERFASGFVIANVHKLETAGHFPQEEQPEEVARVIQNFIIST